MNGKVSIDRAGRVVIPKEARVALGISPGDVLDLSYSPEELTIRPSQHTMPLQKERGIWVLRTGKSLTQAETDAAVDRLRAERSGRGR